MELREDRFSESSVSLVLTERNDQVNSRIFGTGHCDGSKKLICSFTVILCSKPLATFADAAQI
jgi:hypothetical protein